MMKRFENVTKVTHDPEAGWREETVAQFFVAEQPFANGSLRAAFEAHFGDETERFVAKRFLNPTEHAEDDYRLDVQLMSIAHEYGARFNSYNPPKKVNFIEAFLIRAGNDTYAVEPILKGGEFVKFSNNSGFVAPEARNTPHALSHFSWEASNKTMLISDVQGVGDMYTDPGISSMSRQYGDTDLGPAAISFFFASHICNPICTALGLTPFDLGAGQKHSANAMDVQHIGMRRGKTRPVLTRCLTHAATNKKSAPGGLLSMTSPRSAEKTLKASHSLVSMADAVPTEETPDAIIHLGLAVLHERGRLASLYAELKALSEGKEEFSVTSNEPPDLEAALYHFQKAALQGSVDAQMICAQIFSNFQPRDYLPEIGDDILDSERALYYLRLAARKDRFATLHYADMKFAQEQWQEAAKLYEQAVSLPIPTEESPDSSLPHNVWPNVMSTTALYARVAECYELLGKWSDAAEWWGSAAEEAFCDPLKDKQAMQYQEKQSACEAKIE